MEEILIDEKTRQMLLECERAIMIANQRMNDICQTLLNVNKIDGKWNLSPDRTKLLKAKEEKE